jgi:hypothetical protein
LITAIDGIGRCRAWRTPPAQLGAALLGHQIAIAQLLDVGAGAECLGPGARHDQRARLRLRHFVERRTDAADDVERQRVQRFRPVQHQHGALVAGGELDSHHAAPSVC